MKTHIVRAALLLFVGTVFSKLLGFAREIIFAHRFGAGAVSDAFLLTKSIPGIFFSALSLAINMSFIPVYMSIEQQSERNRFVSNFLNICNLFALLIILLINFFPYQFLWFFASTLPEETRYYAIIMLRIVSVSILPMLAKCLFQAYSQANNSFFSTAILGGVTNILTIVTYVVATVDTFEILSLGVVVAEAIVMLMMFWNAKKAGFRYYPVLDWKDQNIASMTFLAIPLMIGQVAEDASLLVDRNLAAAIGTGVISALSYASLFAGAISGVVTNAVATAAFPTFSQFAAEGQTTRFQSVFYKYFSLLCYVLCPISVFMFLFSDELVMCIWAHGALHTSAAKMIWEAAACYAIGILPLGIENYFLRGFYAFRDTKTPTYIILFSLFCNISFSIWSAPFWGHIGISVATSSSYFIAVVLLGYMLVQKYELSFSRFVFMEIIPCLLVATLLGGSIYYLFHGNKYITDWRPIRVLLESSLFFVLYSVFFFMTHRQLFQDAISMLQKKL